MNNSSLANGVRYNANLYSITEKIGFTVAYLILYLVAVVGNCFVIYVARKLLAAGRGPFSMMVINMAAIDILYAVTAVTLQVKFVFVQSLWFPSAFGTFLCKFSHFAVPFFISCSVFSLTAMAVDRYLAIVPNMKRSSTRKRRAVKVILGIALLSIACTWFPLIGMNTVSHTYQGKELTFCGPVYLGIDKDVAEKLRKAEYISYFVLLYALPVIVMSFLYFHIVRFLWLREIPGIRTERNERQKRKHSKKVTCMLITVTTTFAFTWFPVHVVHYYIITDRTLPFSALFSLYWFAHTNCATNPCFYFIFCKDYRDELRRVLGRFFSRNIENREENINLN